MALSIDSNMPSSAGAGSTNALSLTFAFTNTSGTLLVCAIGWGDRQFGSNTFALSSVTYNSVALTSAIVIQYDNTSDGAALYYLLNPATGSNNLVITFTGGSGTNNRAIEAGCTSFVGNDTVSPIGVTNSAKFDTGAGDTTPSVTLAGTSSGNIIMDAMATGSGFSSTGQTLNWSINQNVLTAGGNAASSRAAAGGSVTMSYTVVQDYWGIVAAEIKAAASVVNAGIPFMRNPGNRFGMGF